MRRGLTELHTMCVMGLDSSSLIRSLQKGATEDRVRRRRKGEVKTTRQHTSPSH